MLWPKKNSYKEFDNEKNSCGSKIPLPPITFLMVRPLYTYKKYKGSRKFRIQDRCYFRARIRKNVNLGSI